MPGMELDEARRRAPVRHRAPPPVEGEDPFDEALAERRVVQPALLLAGEEGPGIHHRAREEPAAHARGASGRLMDLDPLHPAARRGAFEDEPPKLLHLRDRAARRRLERFGHVDGVVADPHRAWRGGVAREADGRARDAEPGQGLGAEGDVLEPAPEHPRHVAVELVPTVVADLLAEQAAADADGDAGGRVTGADADTSISGGGISGGGAGSEPCRHGIRAECGRTPLTPKGPAAPRSPLPARAA